MKLRPWKEVEDRGKGAGSTPGERSGTGKTLRLSLFLPLIFLIPVLHPLMNYHPEYTHDGLFHLYRFLELDLCLRQGWLFPRWAPHLVQGYGEPVFNFYAPLAYYVIELIHLVGLPPVQALRASIGFSLLVAVLGTYVFASDVFGERAGLVAAVAFGYSPYILFTTFVRGATPELLAWGLLPWLLTSYGRLTCREGRAYFVLAALGTAAVVLTHNVSALVIVPAALGYGLWLGRHKRTRISISLQACLVGLGIAAFFWGPALLERSYVHIERLYEPSHLHLRRNSLSIGDLFQPWDTIDPSRVKGLPTVHAFRLGGLVVGLVGLILLSFLKKGRAKACLMGASLVTGAALFLVTRHSLPIWRALGLGRFFVSPWRLLGLAAFGWSLLCGGVVVFTDQRLSQSRASAATAALSVSFIALTSITLLYPDQWISDVPKLERPMNAGLSEASTLPVFGDALGLTAGGELIPRWVNLDSLAAHLKKRGPGYIGQDLLEARPGVEITKTGVRLARERFEVRSPLPWEATFSRFYYPGWQVVLDGTRVETYPSSPLGLITAQVPEGTHDLEVRFGDTFLRQAFGGISFIATSLLAARLCFPGSQPLPASNCGIPGMQRTELWAFVVLAGLLIGGKLLLADAAKFPFGYVRYDGRVLRGVQRSLRVDFADKLRLLAYDLEQDTIKSGETSRLSLYWQALKPLIFEYSTSVQLVDSEGFTRAQHDSWHPGGPPTDLWPPGQYAVDEHVLTVPETLPPGKYYLSVSVYREATVEALSYLGPDGSPKTTGFPVAQIEILRGRPACAVGELAIESGEEVFPGLVLSSYSIPGRSVVAGRTVEVWLLLRAKTELALETLALELRSPTGDNLATATIRVATEFKERDTFKFPGRIKVPPGVPPGRYQLVLDSGVAAVRLSRLEVEYVQRRWIGPGRISYPISAIFGEAIELIGYDVTPSNPHPGTSLTLTLFFRVDQTPLHNYKVFAHLLSLEGRLLSQDDHFPQRGLHPTDTWVPGEFISERFAVAVPKVGGVYRLEVGFYDPETMQRARCYSERHLCRANALWLEPLVGVTG